MPKDTGAGHAVDVIIAVDRDAAFVLHCGYNEFGRFVDTGQLGWIVEVTDFCVKKFSSGRGVTKPTRDQHLSQQRGNSQLSAESPNGRFVVRVERPFS